MRDRSPHLDASILQLMTLLVLGAVLNVVVAWACVCWSVVEVRRLPDGRIAEWCAPVPQSWPSVASHWTRSAFGVTDCESRGDKPSDTDSGVHTSQWVLQAGLPLRGMYVARQAVESDIQTFSMPLHHDRPDSWRDGLMIPQQVARSRVNEYRYLPTLVLWPGFAVNTVFYATILWLMLAAPFALRRRLRARRGQCQQCGYPIGVSPVCTECGAALPASAVARLASRHG